MSLILNAAAATLLTVSPPPQIPVQICSATQGCRPGEPVAVRGDYTLTRYPIVLAHGMAGFARLGSMDYWYGIPRDLMSNGSLVFVTQVSAFNSSEVRGEQLLRQVEEIIAITGAEKVNLIGHSHGAQSIRYVAGIRPGLVASVTSVGGPNRGSPVADTLARRMKNHGTTGWVAQSVDRLTRRVDTLNGVSLPQDALASMNSVTTAGALAFNRRFPQGVPVTGCGDGADTVNGVKYYSWSGAGHLTNLLDISDGALMLSGLMIPEPNDGLVGRCSSHLGKVIRDNYFMNHLDEVNQLYGLVSLRETNPKTVYRQHANRLKREGL